MGLLNNGTGVTVLSTLVNGDMTKRVTVQQLAVLVKELNLKPSTVGALAVQSILSDSKLHAAWLREIQAMFERLLSVRTRLFNLLTSTLNTPGEWEYLKTAKGLYWYVLLT
jgi:aspartate aminotransferase